MRLTPITAAALATLAALAASEPARAESFVAGGLYMDQAMVSCGASSFCSVALAPVPAGKTLLVTDAGCSVKTATAAALVEAVLGSLDQGNVPTGKSFYFDPRLTNLTGKRIYQMQLATHFAVRAKEKPVVQLVASAGFGGYTSSCTVSGVLK